MSSVHNVCLALLTRFPPSSIANLLPPAVLSELIETGVLVADKLSPNLLHPRLRVSTLFPCSSPPNYSVHSSWPTSSSDSVFFGAPDLLTDSEDHCPDATSIVGPETYRFVRYLSSVAPRKADSRLVVDVCSGAGAGAFQLAKSYPNATVIGLDINPKAIQLAEINARHLFPDRESTAPIQMVTSDGFSGIISFVRGQVDVVTINPPFIAGDKRTYAAGGPTGMELILRIIGEARDALKIGGELYGHMAAPVSFGGEDRFKSALLALADRWELVTYDVSVPLVNLGSLASSYRLLISAAASVTQILDVDIFGEEMESPDNYPDIARLASVGLVLKRIA